MILSQAHKNAVGTPVKILSHGKSTTAKMQPIRMNATHRLECWELYDAFLWFQMSTISALRPCPLLLLKIAFRRCCAFLSQDQFLLLQLALADIYSNSHWKHLPHLQYISSLKECKELQRLAMRLLKTFSPPLPKKGCLAFGISLSLFIRQFAEK